MTLDAPIDDQAKHDVLRTYRELRSLVATAKALGVSKYQVRKIVNPEAAARARPVGSNHYQAPSEWDGAQCSICRTESGRMFCAARCDGEHCGEPATDERLAEYQAYTAQRRKRNAKATREERRISRRRTEGAVNCERRTVG